MLLFKSMHLLIVSYTLLPVVKILFVLITQLCVTLFDPMDCSLSDSSVYGILQARVLE